LPVGERERVGVALRLTDGDTPAPRELLLRRLYEAGSALVIVPIQDLFGWTDRINVPATPSHANWNWRLPLAVEHLAEDPALRATIATLRELIAAAGRTS
jgi:4-alpha-glucanotransferase